jgi:hypothetical protein
MGSGQADSPSDFRTKVVGDVIAHRSARSSRPPLERLYERDEPVSLEWKNEVRERRALQPRGQKGLIVVRGSVNYQRIAERKWKRCAESGILQRGGGNDSEGWHPVGHNSRHLSNRCRKQNIVVESEQSLRETLEERCIGSH